MVPLQLFRAELKQCFSFLFFFTPGVPGHVWFAAAVLQGQSWAGSALQVISHQMSFIVAEIALWAHC